VKGNPRSGGQPILDKAVLLPISGSSHSSQKPVDAKGDMQEKIYDVAWSGERRPAVDGKLPAVGNTVDVPNANWTNTIGTPELIAVWKDPNFDPKQRAF
jgi:hypothetical protein